MASLFFIPEGPKILALQVKFTRLKAQDKKGIVHTAMCEYTFS